MTEREKLVAEKEDIFQVFFFVVFKSFLRIEILENSLQLFSFFTFFRHSRK